MRIRAFMTQLECETYLCFICFVYKLGHKCAYVHMQRLVNMLHTLMGTQQTCKSDSYTNRDINARNRIYKDFRIL